MSGAGCAGGTVSTFTWQNALQQAAAADFAGHTDWRLPNKNELESLVERRCYDPAINATYFPNTPAHWFYEFFWSASPSAYTPVFVWSVNFGIGTVNEGGKGGGGYVRLVRGGQ